MLYSCTLMTTGLSRSSADLELDGGLVGENEIPDARVAVQS